jgi:hypothetical protein
VRSVGDGIAEHGSSVGGAGAAGPSTLPHIRKVRERMGHPDCVCGTGEGGSRMRE